ncbi:tRNA (guanine(9)-N(1))-methyltransferase [Parahypoxylon ruwenzoriense]
MAETAEANGALLQKDAAVISEIHARGNVNRGRKRPAEDDDDLDVKDGDSEDNPENDHTEGEVGKETPKLSKNQLRKLKRQKMWEEKKKEKKFIRKEKRHEKQERKRLDREAEIAAAAAEGRDPVFQEPPKRQPKSVTRVPISVIIDCQFEKYMIEKELVSLGNQVTRCYSDNRNAQFPVHMFVSSYGGQMQERHETVLQNQHRHWKNVHFTERDFVDAAVYARNLMKDPAGGTIIDLLAQGKDGDSISLPEANDDAKKKQKAAPVPEPEADDVEKSIVYLTADSPYTLDRLEPNTCYVIGGIIDKNREKGLCYKIARQRNVRTAKLPIGEFMVMQSRHVLATNHVMEIMLQWLETGDWGTAFMKVIPMRKGGKLKEDENGPEEDQEDPEGAAQEGKPENDVVVMEGIEPTSPKADEPEKSGAVVAERDGSKDKLEKNALDQQKQPAPPVEAEERKPSSSSATS